MAKISKSSTRNSVNAAAPIQPVKVLRDQVTALEAAIALVLAKPKKRAVHALRTSTRRIQAQPQLLDALAEQDAALAIPKKLRAKVEKRLAEVRKVAGQVRDFDVQRLMLKEYRGHPLTRGDAGKLRDLLKTERQADARRLVETLEEHALELGPLLETMLEGLAGSEQLRVSATRLAAVAEEWYSFRVGERASERLNEWSADELHQVRKTAKLARYMAERGGGAAKRVAEDFEQLQESGGSWHDALLLRKLARRKLGKRSKLEPIFEERERRALEEFRRRVASR
jgi:CHAD domain-containing protein